MQIALISLQLCIFMQSALARVSEAAKQPKTQPTTHKIFTNAVIMDNAPEWLTATRVEQITERIQYKLEWSTRRIPVRWHYSLDEYQKAHSLGPRAVAVSVSRKGKQSVHLGPRVTKENFDRVFAHELVHIILFQKYKKAIPDWLEEGLANHLSKKKKVDYLWLSKQALPEDVTKVGHPFSGSAQSIGLHYKVSQALIEMLESKCDLDTLIRLSVARKMEPYIKTYCEIPDINASFLKWVKQKAG